MAYYPGQITRIICQQINPEAYELQRRFEEVKAVTRDFGKDSEAVQRAMEYYQETRQGLIDLLQVALDNLKAEENETLDWIE